MKTHFGTKLLTSILMLCVAGLPGFDKFQKVQGTSSGAEGQQSAIRGRIVDRFSRQPLSGVHVRLIPFSPRHSENLSPLSPLSPNVVYGALSTENGAFSIKSIAAGNYFVQAEKTGFELIPFTQNRRPRDGVLVVRAGQVVDVELEMAQRATITGTVLDFYGEPMPDVSVEAIAQADELTGGTHQTTSDDTGNFRLSLPPGKYYVVARVAGGPTIADREAIRTDGTQDGQYRDTYYPGSATTDYAKPIVVNPGDRLNNVGIRLLSGNLLSISGVITGINDGIQSVTITLESGKSSEEIHQALSQGVSVDGKVKPFSISQLKPGFYRVYASAGSGDDQLQSKVLEFTLDESAVRDLALDLLPSFSATGSVKIEEDQGSKAERIRAGVVALESLSGVHQSQPGEISPTGAFMIRGLREERYRLELRPKQENEYVKSVRLNDTEYAGDVVDFRNAGERSHLAVTVSKAGAELSGQVRNESGPVSSMVILVQDGKESAPKEWLYKFPGLDGQYRFQGIPPGPYRLFALDPSTTIQGQRKLIQQYFGKTQLLRLREHDKRSEDPTLIKNAPLKIDQTNP